MCSPEQDLNRVASSIGPDLKAFRAAILDLVAEIAVHTDPLNLSKAERVLLDRLEDQELDAVLANTPKGRTGTIRDLLFELRRYRPGNPSCPGDLTRLVRIFLTSQIDAMWWGCTRPFQTDADVLGSPELVDLEALRRRRPLRFRYRCQPASLPSRLVRAVERRIQPDRTPHTAGLRFARTRPETVALLEHVADELAQVAPADTPPPWVTSMARSVSHQHRLRSLGYPAVLPSSHCVGYAVDLEMAWFRRFRADRALAYLLLERQECGDANIIDEGQVWHMCVNPAASARLRDEFEANAGG
ncbi:MAG: hypothetical protein QOE61_4057 [Micromonosporaceae bacterium]|jgi:hypothetical protein|nr:hypothetical protein [Micromonosporaceae bacterium]